MSRGHVTHEVQKSAPIPTHNPWSASGQPQLLIAAGGREAGRPTAPREPEEAEEVEESEEAESPEEAERPAVAGRPLESRLRNQMSASFGYDFSKVRVHADDRAHTAASAHGALAYATGTDIVFEQGSYAPDREDGRRLVAHELAHVIQQSSLPDTGAPSARTIAPQDASEIEAEQAASAVMDGHRPQVRIRLAGAPVVQRQPRPPGRGSGAGGTPTSMAIRNVSGPRRRRCGGFRWRVNYILPTPSPAGGYFVQQLTIRRTATDCAGAARPDDNLTPLPYWEAWRVRPGGRQDELVADGTFSYADEYTLDQLNANTRGTFSYTGSVRYYEGLTLPGTFQPHNPMTFADALPSTTVDPHLTGGTPALAHSISGTWDCCPKDGGRARRRRTVITSRTP